MDGSKIFATNSLDFFVVYIDSKTGDFSVSQKTKPRENFNIALSPNDKYLLTIRNLQLIGYDLNQDFELSDYEVFYDFSSEAEHTSSSNIWHIQTGIDGKIYVACPNFSKLFVVDGIETRDVVVETFELECLTKYARDFPQIMRHHSPQNNPCSLAAPIIICE
jgi:hypothetical protein